MTKLDTSEWPLERLQAAAKAWRCTTEPSTTTAALIDGLALAADDVAQDIAAETALATVLAITAELAKRHGATAPAGTAAAYCENLPNPSAPVVALAQAALEAFLALKSALPYRKRDPERFAATYDWTAVQNELHSALRLAGHPAGDLPRFLAHGGLPGDVK